MSLLYTRPDNWPRLWETRHAEPPSDRDALVNWVHCQHFPTSYETTIGTELDRLVLGHRATSARLLAVSAASDTGKTAAVTNVLLTRAMTHPGGWFTTHPTTHRTHIPFVYVNASASTGSAGLLKQVATFCRFPSVGNETTLRDRLATLLPEHGVQAVVVDEAQVLRRVTAGAKRQVDGLRGLMHLPTPFVFTGVNLQQSALLRDFGDKEDPAYQVRKRTRVVRLEPLNTREGGAELRRLVIAFGRRLRKIPDFDVSGLADSDTVRGLFISCGAQPGLVFEALKGAAAAAAATDGQLTASLLRDHFPYREVVA